MSREPSPYNAFMKIEIPKVMKENPSIYHEEAFKKAHVNWKTSSTNPYNPLVGASTASSTQNRLQEKCFCGNIISSTCDSGSCEHCCSSSLCSKHGSARSSKKTADRKRKAKQSQSTPAVAVLTSEPKKWYMDYKNYYEYRLDEDFEKAEEVLTSCCNFPKHIAGLIMEFAVEDSRSYCPGCDKHINTDDFFPSCADCHITFCDDCVNIYTIPYKPLPFEYCDSACSECPKRMPHSNHWKPLNKDNILANREILLQIEADHEEEMKKLSEEFELRKKIEWEAQGLACQSCNQLLDYNDTEISACEDCGGYFSKQLL
jgi:hypothetical protein